MTAAELREQAAQLFLDAQALVDGVKEEDITAELEGKFQSKLSEAKAKDVEYRAKAGSEGSRVDLKDSLAFYAGKVGAEIDWNKVHQDPGMKGLPHYNGGIAMPYGTTLETLGDKFVNSEEFKELQKSGVLNSDGAKFKTRPIGLKAATDIVSGTVDGTSGNGPGSALLTPQFLPGVLGLPQQPLTIRDLFSQATTTSDTLSFARQNSFDNGAAAVQEAASDGTPTGAKPQSSIGWTRQTTPIETIATWMAATRKQLSDEGQTRSLIDNQGRLMIRLEEEDQLLNGDGTSPNISGLLDQGTLQTLDLSLAAGDRANLDGVRTAKRLVRTGPARAAADAVVVNPVDSEEFDLMVDNEGRYRAGDPFGNGVEAPPIWRLRRVESEAVDEGTAIVGAFRQGGTVYEREGLVTYTSDSHADFFIRNLIAILFEERLGLAVFFPTAFVVITLKAWA